MNIICIDDEQAALDGFEAKIRRILPAHAVRLFRSAREGVAWAMANPTELVFLDMEMPDMHGVEAAKLLHASRPDIRIVFMTAYSNYALDAFEQDALGYVLKPYSTEKLRHEIEKAERMRPAGGRRVRIVTMPNFEIFVDDRIVPLGRTKSKELLALLVDRAGAVLTAADAMACIYPDKADDESGRSAFRMTYKRLVDQLEAAGIAYILSQETGKRRILCEQVKCDLYDCLSGSREALNTYAGAYMSEYAWAQKTNERLSRIAAQQI